MKFLLATVLLLTAVVFTRQVEYTEEYIIEKWNDFKTKFNKTYADDESYRKQLFADNLRKIEEHNERYRRGDETYEMGINQFSDLTEEEFKGITK